MIEARNVFKTYYVPHKVEALVDVSTRIAACLLYTSDAADE